jgi:hypothetical protein
MKPARIWIHAGPNTSVASSHKEETPTKSRKSIRMESDRAGFAAIPRGGDMRETRRRFLVTAAVLGSCLAAGNAWLVAQHRNMKSPPPPAMPPNPNAQTPDLQATRKALLARNEKEFREGIERLYELTGELRDEVQKTATTDVLSVRMYKKTEEIEKLAKQLKGKAKGS